VRFETRLFPLRERRIHEIREANPSDAAALHEHIEIVCAETDYITLGPGELGLSVAEEERILRSFQIAENQLFLIGTLDSEIVGVISFAAGLRPRVRHVGEFGMSVRKNHWGLGIGSALLDSFIGWAREHEEITKIALRVRIDNERAIRLYTRKGFVREGTARRDLRIDGMHFDHDLMGLFV
jgi:RimJ/RimL family protein N-acetyltransferase